jgi:hypothetical protein
MPVALRRPDPSEGWRTATLGSSLNRCYEGEVDVDVIAPPPGELFCEVTDNLQEVNNSGIVLSVETQVGHLAQLLFYPWRAVIQLSEERDG